LLLRMLQEQPKLRPWDAGELLQLLQGEREEARREAQERQRKGIETARTLPVEGVSPAKPSKRRGWLALAGLGGLGLAGLITLGLAIWGLWSAVGGEAHTPTPEASATAATLSAQQTENALETRIANAGQALAETQAAGTQQARSETLAASTSQAWSATQAALTAAAKVTLPPPPQVSRQITDAKGVPMALIPAGEFQMGSENGEGDEKPVHTVYLDAFYIDVYEATNARYAECVSTGDCKPPTSSSSYTRDSYYGEAQYADYPVIYVSWEMAKTYCEWRGGSLPSEAQWEKAARGGLEGMEYPWGNENPVCEKGAQNGANFGSCGTRDTERVGSYSPNGYGLYDMAGNVWEWVLDWYQADYYAGSPARNPPGPSNGEYRVVRGGSWFDVARILRAAFRIWYYPGIWTSTAFVASADFLHV